MRIALEKASGQKLSGFFARWVYDSGHPQYELSWEWLPEQKSVKVSLTQAQAGEAFLDPLPIMITTGSGNVNAVVTPGGKMTSQTIGVSDKPMQIAIDPQNTLLKEVTIK